jgi:Fe2+ transport system protein B
MKNLILMLVVLLALACQATASAVDTTHEDTTVVSAMLYQPYLAALLSLIALIATLI